MEEVPSVGASGVVENGATSKVPEVSATADLGDLALLEESVARDVGFRENDGEVLVEIYISGIALFAMCAFLAIFRNVGPIIAMGVALPFESTALMTAGGVGLNVFDAFFIAVIGVHSVYYFSRRGAKIIYIQGMRLPFWICVHGLTVTLLAPLVFSGDFPVAPVSGQGEGEFVGRGFGLTIVPLEPSASNISQLFYLFLHMGMFCYFLAAARRYGPEVLFRLLAVAGFVNIVMVGLEFSGLTAVQQWFFTADYRDLSDASVLGFNRIVGGFREAARQGQFSAMIFTAFFAYFISSGRFAYILISAVFLVIAVMTLSSTAIICIMAGVGFMMMHGIFNSFRVVDNRSAKRSGLILIALVAAPFVAWSAIGPVGRLMVEASASELIFNKVESASGLERRALWDIGNNVAKETYYLGAGIGSTRSNGLLGLWLSNVGIVGLFLMAAFIYNIFLPKRVGVGAESDNLSKRDGVPIFVARTTFFVVLTASLLSLTMPSLGQLFPITAAFAFSVAERPSSVRASSFEIGLSRSLKKPASTRI